MSEGDDSGVDEDFGEYIGNLVSADLLLAEEDEREKREAELSAARKNKRKGQAQGNEASYERKARGWKEEKEEDSLLVKKAKLGEVASVDDAEAARLKEARAELEKFASARKSMHPSAARDAEKELEGIFAYLKAPFDVESEIKQLGGTLEQVDEDRALRLLRSRFLDGRKEKLANIGAVIMSQPEKEMKRLGIMVRTAAEASDLVVKKTAILATANVFLDVLPLYPLRTPSQAERNVHHKKEVKALWNYEVLLLKNYDRYIAVCSKLCALKQPAPLRRAAAHSLMSLLNGKPLFNYTNRIVSILVNLLGDSDPLLGAPLLEQALHFINNNLFVDCVAEFIKLCGIRVTATDFQCPADVVGLFHGVALQEALIVRKEERERGPEDEKDKDKGRKGKKGGKDATKHRKEEERKRRQEFRNSVHLQQAQREVEANALAKDRLERDLEEGTAEISPAEKSKKQSKIVDDMVTCYFRVLKKAPTSDLLGAALRGLAKHAFFVNIDFMDDIIEALATIAANVDIKVEYRFTAVSSAFLLLSQGLGTAFIVDLTTSHTALYHLLTLLPMLTFDQVTEDVMHTLAAAFLAIDAALLSPTTLPKPRAAAFVKRLSEQALLCNTELSVLLLNAVRMLCRRYPAIRGAFSSEGEGEGRYLPEADVPDFAGALDVPAWESALLKQSVFPAGVRMVSDAITCTAHPQDSQKHVLSTSYHKLLKEDWLILQHKDKTEQRLGEKGERKSKVRDPSKVCADWISGNKQHVEDISQQVSQRRLWRQPFANAKQTRRFDALVEEKEYLSGLLHDYEWHASQKKKAVKGK
jgi:hypothetical protein